MLGGAGNEFFFFFSESDAVISILMIVSHLFELVPYKLC